MERTLVCALALFMTSMAMCLAQIRPEVTPAELIVESTPGADVTLDGKRAGEIAASGRLLLRGISPGEHTLRIASPGKRAFTKKVVIVSGKPNHIRAPLADFSGDLEVFTTPDAEVLVDGKPAGVANGVGRLLVRGVSATTHTVRAGRAGFNAEERTVDITADLVSTVTMELRPIEAAGPVRGGSAPEFVMERKLSGHTAGDVVPVFRSDSLQLLSHTISGDRMLRLWDPASGRETGAVELGSGYVVLAASPDLRRLAVTTPGRATGVIAILDSASGKEVRRLPQQPSDTWHGAFSPDGNRLVTTARDRKAIIWDTRSGAVLHAWEDACNDEVAYSPDGRWVATGNEDVCIRDANTGVEVRRIPARDRVMQLTFSPDSRWLAVANGLVELWDPATGKQGRTIEPPSGEKFTEVVFTADSGFLAAAVGEAIRLWDTGTGEETRSWAFPASARVAFSPDGKWMATGESVKDTGLSIWRRKESPGSR